MSAINDLQHFFETHPGPPHIQLDQFCKETGLSFTLDGQVVKIENPMLSKHPLSNCTGLQVEFKTWKLVARKPDENTKVAAGVSPGAKAGTVVSSELPVSTTPSTPKESS